MRERSEHQQRSAGLPEAAHIRTPPKAVAFLCERSEHQQRSAGLPEAAHIRTPPKAVA